MSNDLRSCIKCPPYTKADSTNRVCQPDDCRSSYLYVAENGYCKECPEGFVSDSTNNACVPRYNTFADDAVTCNKEREIYADDFKTCVACPEFTRAFDFNSRCASEKCSATEILNKEGKCTNCGPNRKADATGRICEDAPAPLLLNSLNTETVWPGEETNEETVE